MDHEPHKIVCNNSKQVFVSDCRIRHDEKCHMDESASANPFSISDKKKSISNNYLPQFDWNNINGSFSEYWYRVAFRTLSNV